MNLYINKNLAQKKQLISDNSTEIYNKLENYYKYLFEKYLTSKVNLKEYSKKIANSNLGFITPIITKPIPNQLNENFDFDYFYNLNNFFIEKLSNEDLNLLAESFINKITTSEKLTNLIERTYKEVIKNNFLSGKYVDEEYKIVYGMSTPDNFARNNAIVLKIYYSIIDRNDTKEEFLERYNKVTTFFDELKEEISKVIEERLNINCDVLLQMK